eukprot:scaffold128423_cov66-Phaeocystis_antarctica.AAC.4
MASGCHLLSRLCVTASGGSASRSSWSRRGGGGAPAHLGAVCGGPGRAESDSRPAVHASALDVEIPHRETPPRPRLGLVGR